MTLVAGIVKGSPLVETFIVDDGGIAILTFGEDCLDLVVHTWLAVVAKTIVVFCDIFPETLPLVGWVGGRLDLGVSHVFLGEFLLGLLIDDLLFLACVKIFDFDDMSFDICVFIYDDGFWALVIFILVFIFIFVFIDFGYDLLLFFVFVKDGVGYFVDFWGRIVGVVLVDVDLVI